MKPKTAHRIAQLAMFPLRAAARAMPARWRTGLEDRLFYAIFQMTRVENDAYPRREGVKEEAPSTPG